MVKVIIDMAKVIIDMVKVIIDMVRVISIITLQTSHCQAVTADTQRV